jgi:dienelactone hydrolase
MPSDSVPKCIRYFAYSIQPNICALSLTEILSPQGADILANSNNVQVFVPDFFRGSPAMADWFPTDTEEKGQKLQAWVQGPAQISVAVENAGKIADEIKSGNSITKVVAVGFCWGAKV